MTARLSKAQQKLVEARDQEIQRVALAFLRSRPHILNRHSREDIVQEARLAYYAAVKDHQRRDDIQVDVHVYALALVRQKLRSYGLSRIKETTSDADVQDPTEHDEELLDTACQMLRELPVSERAVIVALYGLNGSPACTQLTAASRLGHTRFWVQRMKQRAEARLARWGEDLESELTDR